LKFAESEAFCIVETQEPQFSIQSRASVRDDADDDHHNDEDHHKWNDDDDDGGDDDAAA
jgi:hypothetical protein